MAEYNLSNSSAGEEAALFKSKFGKISENVYNSANVMLGRVKKSYDFVGKNKIMSMRLGFQGGVGSGSLPTANPGRYEDPTITAKKMYARVEVDRETIKAAKTDEGSFVRFLKEPTEKTVEAWNRNMSRALWGNGDGSLGVTTAAVAGGSAIAPTVVISDETWNEANFEESDYVNVNTLSSVFEITAVDADTKTLTLARISGSDDLTAIATAKTIYMQNSKDNDPTGLKKIADATSSTLYGVAVGRRWRASYQGAAAGASITPDRINRAVMDYHFKTGKSPELICASYTQYRKILNFSEDQKEYKVPARYVETSFRGIEHMTPNGPAPVFMDRFVDADRVYYVNSDFIEICHRPDFGWFDDDGTVFLRKSDADTYEARYGGYLEVYAQPPFVGVDDGLST